MDARPKRSPKSGRRRRRPIPAPPKAPPCLMVIFGARGDLAKRLLVPALYNLARAGLLAKDFSILGVDHGDCDAKGLRKGLGDFLKSLAADKQSEFGAAKIDPKAWGWLAERIDYQVGDFEDDATYAAIGERLKASAAASRPASSSTWPPRRVSSATSSSGWTKPA